MRGRGRISTLTVTRSRERQRVDRENATDLPLAGARGYQTIGG